MERVTRTFKKYPHLPILFLILAIATFFRTYQIIERFNFAHDGDLYSWIVKDIVVDGHLRLIGQETSAPGIFIGPLYYYTLIPFFLLFNMDPIGAIVPITAIGILTVASYYWVFARLFSQNAGLIAAFLQAVLLAQVWEDRWVVPSTSTNIWTIWYFFAVVSLARGNYKVLPLLGILIALIWHIHIALLPALAAIPVAILVAKKLPSVKQAGVAAAAFFITSIPLLLFETRHGFSQTAHFIADLSRDHGGGTGLEKANLVTIKFTATVERLFFYPNSFPLPNHRLFLLLFILSAVILVKKKILKLRELVLFYAWIAGILLFYSISSSFISEYYFANVNVILIGIVSLWLAFIFQKTALGKIAVITLLAIIFTKNFFFYISEDLYKKGYNERKTVAEFIAKDSKEKGFPCVSVSYITSPGENVGFRYFFWLKDLHVNKPGGGSPVYNIVLPPEYAAGKDEVLFGQIKVILPEEVLPQEEIKKSCSGENSNLTDPMLGFTK